MNLIEAIKSGKPFRNKEFDPNHWFKGVNGGWDQVYPRVELQAEDGDGCDDEDCEVCLSPGFYRYLSSKALLADWEVRYDRD